jgi:hypothetical protein
VTDLEAKRIAVAIEKVWDLIGWTNVILLVMTFILLMIAVTR